ncbi:MAG TPA: hypothetical protein VK338_01825 [Candidatus Nitrosocosmicus sp.]|nr:hypothetical protein [Candidatus Nitrosocosmicus sp.]
MSDTFTTNGRTFVALLSNPQSGVIKSDNNPNRTIRLRSLGYKHTLMKEAILFAGPETVQTFPTQFYTSLEESGPIIGIETVGTLPTHFPKFRLQVHGSASEPKQEWSTENGGLLIPLPDLYSLVTKTITFIEP